MCAIAIPAVTGRNDIPEVDFPDHVKQMHQDRDRKFELEYKVRRAPSASYTQLGHCKIEPTSACVDEYMCTWTLGYVLCSH